MSQSILTPGHGAGAGEGNEGDPRVLDDTAIGPVEPRTRVRRRRGNRSPSRRRRMRRLIAEWLTVLGVAAGVAFLLRTFVVQAYYVPSSSMVPTLQVGDRILVDKLFFSPSSLHDGDIVVFSHPPGDKQGICDDPNAADLVKRVVATPGQTVTSKGNQIFVDGRRQPEPYLPAGTQLGKAVPMQRIPAGHYFVMGDNRSLSCDSRYWGTVVGSTIVGRVVAVIWRGGLPDLHWF